VTPSVPPPPDQKVRFYSQEEYATKRGEDRSMDASKEEYSARRHRRHRSKGHNFRYGTSTPCAALAMACTRCANSRRTSEANRRSHS
jgi:hypothetical protein